MEVGAGTVLRVEGTLSGGEPSGGLRLRVGEVEREVDGWVAGAARGEVDWWALVPLPAALVPGRREVALLSPGAELPLGALQLEPGEPLATAGLAEPSPSLIAICMATHEPRFDWLARQIESIREQTWDEWICLISDDCSGDEAFAGIERAVGGDPRFVVSRSPERLGFYANFERALRLVPPASGLVALADQDDRWDPDKLAALHATLEPRPGALLAYSDMRIVDEGGNVLAGSYWYVGRNSSDDLVSQMVNNAVTGAASLFRRELLEVALPFPPRSSESQYHDHWLGLCALAQGELAFLDRATYDYTRHGESVTLRAESGRPAPPRGSLGRLRMEAGRWTRRLRMGATPLGWRRVYFDGYLMIRQFSEVLELRLGDRMPAGKRRALARLVRAERSPSAAAWLLARTLRPLIGRNETLGRERVLLGSLAWRAWASALARLRR